MTDRVLVLDGQTTQALACVRSLGRAGHTVFVASPLRRPLAAWSRYCRGHFRLRADTVDGFAALRVWARKQGVRFVLPQRERSCVLCNAERWKWEALGITIGCAPEDLLLGAFDKARTLQHAAACGVRIPPSRLPRTLAECLVAAEAIGYGCLLKPRFSDFWDGRRFLPDRGTQYVRDAAALEAKALASRQGECWPVIQGIVPGQGKGVFALCDQGEPIVWFAHERLRDVRPSGSGSSLRRSIPLDARLKEPAARLLSAMRWHGPAMVEFRDDGTSEPCLIEVNGRFWGSLELAVASGVDFPRLWMELLSGAPVQPSSDYQTGVTSRWLWGDVKRLLYIVAGPPPGFPDPYPSVRAGLREVLGPQPPGTRSETWSAGDRWPAVGEWIQGIGELSGVVRTGLGRRLFRTTSPHRAAATRVPAPRTPAAKPAEADAHTPMVSVIVPCRNEEHYIERCLDSILASDHPREALEVLVVDGRSDDGTRAVLDDYASRHPIVRVLDNPGRIQAAALNIGIRAARGEILVRMDAHVVYPANYIADLVAALQQTGADNVGGVLVTLPGNETAIGKAIAIAMSHPFGVGNSHFRIGAQEPRWVDTVAFFCCRRETFDRVGMFDEEMAQDEDSEFNARLIQCGGRVRLVPNVMCYYYARGSLGQVARMSYQYGYSKPLVARKLGRVVTGRQLVPPGFVLTLAATAILSPWVDAAGLLFAATVAVYLLPVLGLSLSIGRKAGWKSAAALALVFPVLHISYGLGFLKCVLQLALGSGHRARQVELPLSR